MKQKCHKKPNKNTKCCSSTQVNNCTDGSQDENLLKGVGSKQNDQRCQSINSTYTRWITFYHEKEVRHTCPLIVGEPIISSPN